MRRLADALGWGLLALHDAKGMFDEDHPAFLGVYLPGMSAPAVKQVFDAADGILFVGEHGMQLPSRSFACAARA